MQTFQQAVCECVCKTILTALMIFFFSSSFSRLNDRYRSGGKLTLGVICISLKLLVCAGVFFFLVCACDKKCLCRAVSHKIGALYQRDYAKITHIKHKKQKVILFFFFCYRLKHRKSKLYNTNLSPDL